jgi:hypothetical protein
MTYIIDTTDSNTIISGLRAAAREERSRADTLLKDTPEHAELARGRAEIYEQCAGRLAAQPNSDSILLPRDICEFFLESWAPEPHGPIAQKLKQAVAGQDVEWPR